MRIKLSPGFIGAGRMGRPMVRRLIGAGDEVCVLAGSQELLRALAGDGAHPVTDLGGAASSGSAGVAADARAGVLAQYAGQRDGGSSGDDISIASCLPIHSGPARGAAS